MGIEEREAIGEHDTEVVNREWDGAGVESQIDNDAGADTLRPFYAFRNPAAEPDTKEAYSFIHHHVDRDTGEVGPANLTACRTGIAILNGARGVDPEGQVWSDSRQGIWDHLAAHIRDAGEEPPELQERSVKRFHHTQSQVSNVRDMYESETEEKERRSYPIVEIRAQDDGDQTRIDGHAAVFDEPTTIRGAFGSFQEVIKPGAFDRVIEEKADVRYLINHNPDALMGRVSNGTLDLSVTSDGLRYENTPPDTSYARDALEVIGRGDMDQSSFGFGVEEENWLESDGGEPIREIHSVWPMFDVSSVTFPAYSGTDVGLRAELRSLRNRVGVNLERLSYLIMQSERSGLSDDQSRELQNILSTIRSRTTKQTSSSKRKRYERKLELYRRRING